jgi:hypothetical protein
MRASEDEDEGEQVVVRAGTTQILFLRYCVSLLDGLPVVLGFRERWISEGVE